MTDALKPAWVVLTIGSDPELLIAALDSIRSQSVGGPIVLVNNGNADIGQFDDVHHITLEDNIGIPAGRALGLRALPDDVDVAFFLDDDAKYLHDHVAANVLDLMSIHRQVAIVSLGIVDQDGAYQRRYIPRLGMLGADRSGPVTYFSGCAHAMRRKVFLQADGYPGDFFYGHEELDLAWRLLDGGHTIWYDADKAVVHPQVPLRLMRRHRYGMLARNRVLLARRNLPAPMHVVHSLVWLAHAALRLPDRAAFGYYVRAWRDAWRAPVDRSPVSWSTMWRMTLLRRPPFL